MESGKVAAVVGLERWWALKGRVMGRLMIRCGWRTEATGNGSARQPRDRTSDAAVSFVDASNKHMLRLFLHGNARW